MVDNFNYKFINLVDYNKDIIQDIFFYIDNKVPKVGERVDKYVYPYCSLLEVLYNIFLVKQTRNIKNSYIVFIGIDNALKEILHEGYKNVYLKDYDMTTNNAKITKEKNDNVVTYLVKIKSLNFDSFVYLPVSNVILSVRDFIIQNNSISPYNNDLLLAINIPIDETLCSNNLTMDIPTFLNQLNVKGKELEDPYNPEFQDYTKHTIYKWYQLGYWKFKEPPSKTFWVILGGIIVSTFAIYVGYKTDFTYITWLYQSGTKYISELSIKPITDFFKNMNNKAKDFFVRIYNYYISSSKYDTGVSDYNYDDTGVSDYNYDTGVSENSGTPMNIDEFNEKINNFFFKILSR